jgi:hypothetical protein
MSPSRFPAIQSLNNKNRNASATLQFGNYGMRSFRDPLTKRSCHLPMQIPAFCAVAQAIIVIETTAERRYANVDTQPHTVKMQKV